MFSGGLGKVAPCFPTVFSCLSTIWCYSYKCYCCSPEPVIRYSLCAVVTWANSLYRVRSVQLLFPWCHVLESLWKWVWCVYVLINRSNPAIASAGRAGRTLLYINLITCAPHPPELSCFSGLFPFYLLRSLSWCYILLSDVFPACPFSRRVPGRSPVTTTRSCFPRPLAAAAGPAPAVLLPPTWILGLLEAAESPWDLFDMWDSQHQCEVKKNKT